MGTPIRAAIVGTGNIARQHAEALGALDGEVEIVAGVDVDARRLETFCDTHGIGGRYPLLADMLTAARPDLVSVCTPPGLHHEQARGCLRAGASVLVEKPPTCSVRQLAELAAAQRPGRWLATVFQHRFGSGARRLRAMLDAGVLGRPLLAVCHTTWYRPQEYFDVPWRGRFDTEGGGPTMGHGIHQMDLLTAVLGDWVEVRALARRQARRIDTEDLSMAHVTFANGAVASVVNSVLSPREESYLRFDFEYGTVELTHLYGYGDDDWRVTPAPGHDEVADAWRAGESGRPSGHRAQLAEVVAALRAGTAPPVTTADAMRTMTLVAGIYASAFGAVPVAGVPAAGGGSAGGASAFGPAPAAGVPAAGGGPAGGAAPAAGVPGSAGALASGASGARGVVGGGPVTPAQVGPGSPFHDRMDGDGARWPVVGGTEEVR